MFLECVDAIFSGLHNTLHILSDLDGDIYLKRTTDNMMSTAMAL